MLVITTVISVVILLSAIFVKRNRDRREFEQHSITPQDLNALLASKKDLALFDVRLPLDLLSHSVIIPGAKWFAPDDVAANPSLIPRDQDSIVYCTCPGEKTSRVVMHRALALGYQRIRFLKGGLEEWISSGFPVEHYDKPFSLSSGGSNVAA